MTKFITPGDLIEGKKCHVVTRKYETKRLQRDPITKKPMLLYELDRNCSVEITECLQLSEDDLNLRVCKIMLVLGLEIALKAMPFRCMLIVSVLLNL